MVSRLEIRKSKETVCCCCGENKKLVELVLIETKSERVLPVLSLCEKCRKNLIATLQMCTKGAIVESSGDTINVTMNGSNNTFIASVDKIVL